MIPTGTTSSDKLICAITGHGQGERLMRRARAAGARGGTLLPGRGTATGGLLGLLCLDDQEKDVLLILGTAAQVRTIGAAWRATRSESRTVAGVSFSLGLEAVLRPQRAEPAAAPVPADSASAQSTNPVAASKPETPMSEQQQTPYDLICLIVNAGFADDAMAAARKAGAPGGTVLKARGTASGEDARFFGMTLFPEKEVLLMLVPRDKADAVRQAVREADCLKKPGMGIAFSSAVDDFFPLGKI